jgi:hypothetical protein
MKERHCLDEESARIFPSPRKLRKLLLRMIPAGQKIALFESSAVFASGVQINHYALDVNERKILFTSNQSGQF